MHINSQHFAGIYRGTAFEFIASKDTVLVGAGLAGVVDRVRQRWLYGLPESIAMSVNHLGSVIGIVAGAPAGPASIIVIPFPFLDYVLLDIAFGRRIPIYVVGTIVLIIFP
ncbi:hypothetical protein [Microbulbifer halophilus]|uniref:hypothetical protein n=1 Tax=Microbulbifer halophilus TaxID=453963 RepID=UPI00361191D9